MSGAPMVAPSPAVVFRSLYRPDLILDEDDVSLCDLCGEESAKEYAATTQERGDCACCLGYRIVHGYTHGGRGLPAVLEDRREVATPAHTGPEAHSRGSRGTRLPLPDARYGQ